MKEKKVKNKKKLLKIRKQLSNISFETDISSLKNR